MIDFHEILYTAISRELDDLGIKHFLGGSRRFGYHTHSSDLDIHVRDFVALRSNFLGLTVEYSPDYNAGSSLFIWGNGLVHFIGHKSEKSFRETMEGHDRAEAFLKRNPDTVKLIRRLRSEMKISGKTIYNLLEDPKMLV